MSHALLELLQHPPPGATALALIETTEAPLGGFILDGLEDLAGGLVSRVVTGADPLAGGTDEQPLFYQVGWKLPPPLPFHRVVIR